MQRAIHNHKGDVYDPFVGSGTTVIAGEQEGRRVYGIEIDPRYVDGDGHAVGRLHRQENHSEAITYGHKISHEGATTPLTEAQVVRPSGSAQAQGGRATHCGAPPVSAMKYRLAGATYRVIAEKLTEEWAQAYADAKGISIDWAMKKIQHVSIKDRLGRRDG